MHPIGPIGPIGPTVGGAGPPAGTRRLYSLHPVPRPLAPPSGSQAPAWEPNDLRSSASDTVRGGSLADAALPSGSLGARESALRPHSSQPPSIPSILSSRPAPLALRFAPIRVQPRSSVLPPSCASPAPREAKAASSRRSPYPPRRYVPAGRRAARREPRPPAASSAFICGSQSFIHSSTHPFLHPSIPPPIHSSTHPITRSSARRR